MVAYGQPKPKPTYERSKNKKKTKKLRAKRRPFKSIDRSIVDSTKLRIYVELSMPFYDREKKLKTKNGGKKRSIRLYGSEQINVIT